MGTEGTWSWEEEATCEEPEEAGQGQALEGGEGRDNTSSVKHSEARLLQLLAAPPTHTHTFAIPERSQVSCKAGLQGRVPGLPTNPGLVNMPVFKVSSRQEAGTGGGGRTMPLI